MILTIFFGALLLLFWPMFHRRRLKKMLVVGVVLLAMYELSRILYHLTIVKV